MSIRLEHIVLGQVSTNCYILINDENKQCIVVDPADRADKISSIIEDNGCVLQGILLTHGHYDHILAAETLREQYNAKIYAGKEESDILAQPDKNLSVYIGGSPLAIKADELLSDGQEFKLAEIYIKAIHTPGHTQGGMCYYIEQEGILLSGDTLFAESVGRTDFPTGSMSKLVESIKTKLLTLPLDTKIYPGHGESTSVKYEQMYNPYCQ